MPSEYPLLRRAEQLIGQKDYDPLLLLLLVMDEDVLLRHSKLGVGMVEKLQPLLADCNKESLLQEVKLYVSHHLPSDMSWRLASNHSPNVFFKAKKDELLDCHKQDSICPTVMQMVYRSGARRHCLAPKFVDAVHIQMLDLLLEDEELHCSRRGAMSRRPLQVPTHCSLF
jgi:hypothetical protein